MLAWMQEERMRNREYESPEITLENYVTENPSDKSVEEVRKLLLKADHLELVDDIIRYLILKREKKRGTVWVYGAPNGGKTTLLV